ncbi:MAG: hypothetical protein Q9174_001527 [Haloplaca sp. 1 TL-2023]
MARRNDQSTAATRRMSVPNPAGANISGAAVSNIEASPGWPSLQFSPDMYSFPLSTGPATAPILPQHKLFYEGHQSQDTLSFDDPSQDPFAMGLGIDKTLDPFAASQEQGTPSRLPSTSFQAVGGSHDDFAVFPVSAKVQSKRFNKSRVSTSGVNPSMLFSSPGQSSDLPIIPSMQPDFGPTFQPYAHQIQDAERELEHAGPRRSKRRKGLENDSPAVKAALESLRDEGGDRPTVRRSFTDSIVQAMEDSRVKAALHNDNALRAQKRTSPIRQQRERRESSYYKAAPQPRRSTKLGLRIDSTGRATTKEEAVEDGTKPSSQMEIDSSSEDEESSESTEEDGLARSQRQSFAFGGQKPKKSKLARFVADPKAHSQKSSYGSTLTSNSTISGSGISKIRGASRRSSHFDNSNSLPPLLQEAPSSSTVISDRLDGKPGHASDDTMVNSDDDVGNAQSELKKLREIKQRRTQSRTLQSGWPGTSAVGGQDYPNPMTMNIQTFQQQPGNTMYNDPFNISPTTITDPDLTAPNSASTEYSTRCICGHNEEKPNMILWYVFFLSPPIMTCFFGKSVK